MRHLTRPLGAVLFAAVALVPLPAQRRTAGAHAIVNARIVPVSGATIARGTVVVRDGIIVAVGSGVAVPADARVIEGDGLTVYPGFIDAYGTLGVPATTGGTGAAAARPTAPNSTNPAGMQPEMAVVDLLRAGEDFAAAHAAGITTALTAQGLGVFRGQSAVINLAGSDVSQMVVKAPVAQHVSFTRGGGGGGGGGGGYPGSLLGVLAGIRQQLLDAQHYQASMAAYASASARGMARPDRDASLEAMQPVLARQVPLVFFANTQREIERALGIAREFNVRPIIAGGNEAWKVADRLRVEGVPVLLNINFPRRTAAPAPEADPDPVRVLRERVDAPKGPGRLAAARVKFAVHSGGSGSLGEFLANMRRAVDNGLSAEQATRALTLDAAEILGVADRLGSIEVGKIANLTLVRGDLFDRSSRVAQVVIDGRPIVVPAPAAAPAGPGGAPRGGNAERTASGTWTMVVSLEGADRTVTLSLRQDGDRLAGTMQGGMGSAEIQNGAIGSDGEFRFTASVTLRDGTEEAVFVGMLDGNSMRGGVSIVGHALGRFSATRPATEGARRPGTP